jgi:hypothetical protein
MNNKIILTLAVFSLLIITSCGGVKEGYENKESKAPTVCECKQ